MNSFDETDEFASLVRRASILLSAGISPSAAWGFLAEGYAEQSDGDENREVPKSKGAPIGKVAQYVAVRATTQPVSISIRDSIPINFDKPDNSGKSEELWRLLGLCWEVAETVGAPLAASLDVLADSIQEISQTHREIAAALAGPKATSRIVLMLPLVGLLFGTALGFDLIGILLSNGIGIFCLLVGAALVVTSIFWSRSQLRRALRLEANPGLEFELLEIALCGGISVSQAKQVIERASTRFGITTNMSKTESILMLSQRAGAPIRNLLNAEARFLRRKVQIESRSAISKLAVRQLLPLGICVLPAFMLLGVAPIMISIVSTVLGASN